MQHSQALAQRIDARLAELKTEIEAHERALAALQRLQPAGQKRTASTNGRRASTNGRRTRTDRARDSAATPRPSKATSTEAVFDALKDGHDQAAEIARQFGVSTAVVRQRLQQLEEAGRVSRTGNRRSTRWRSHAA